MTTASAPPRAVLEVLRLSTAYLAERGVPDARLDAERLLAHALKLDRLALYLGFDRPLTDAELGACRERVRRRGQREPLQYILGDQPFRRLTLTVTPDTLIPRPETEELVDRALAELDRIAPPEAATDTPPQVLDLGTGSGCIALALAAERPHIRVLALECSDAALAVAVTNTRAAGLDERVTVVAGDMADPPPGPFHLIVSNPPYLTPSEWAAAPPEVRDFEPREALVGGEDGLDRYRDIFPAAVSRLHPGAAVVVEIGATQGDAVAALARDAGLLRVTVERDLAGRERMVAAHAPAAGDSGD